MPKAGWAFLAFWPVAMMIAMFASIFVWQFDDPGWFGWAWVAGTVLFALSWILFIWNVWHNPAVPIDKRALWTAVLFFAGPYAMPFYFWYYLRENVSPN